MSIAYRGKFINAALIALTLAACSSEEEPPSKVENSAEEGDGGKTKVDGGRDGGGRATVDAGEEGVLPVNENTATWHRDIAPLVSEKCTGCHAAGAIAPFALTDYAMAKKFAKAMASAVESGSMPPFLAQDTADCKPRFEWLGDIRLTAEEKAKIRDWADHGAPEGNAAGAPAVKPPEPVTLDKEDVRLVLPTTKVSGIKDVHLCAIVDPQLAKDVYVINRLITPGNHQVLHHVVSYIIKPGKVDDPFFGPLLARPRTKAELEALLKAQKGVGIGGAYECFGGPALAAPIEFEMLDAWAPGSIPNKAPPNSGQPMAKDALVLLDIHYHPTGAGEDVDEGSRLGLTITETAPKYVSRTVLIGNFEKPSPHPQGDGDLLKQSDETAASFVVPPNAKNHIEESTWKWKLPLSDLKVYGLGTHMHYVGRNMRITVDHAKPKEGEPASECLIETPNWDFNWQRGYGYDATYETYPRFGDGDVVHFRCEYDNTMQNRFVAQALENQGKTAPVEVKLGEDTLDEMCLGAIGIMYPNAAAGL